MSRILGIPDFGDFVEQEGIEYLQRIKIYVGYYNYLMDIPIETKHKKTYEDWVPFFRYIITAKSLYKNLGGGYIVLSDRDYLSEQDDKVMTYEARQKITNMREKNKEYLLGLGFTEEQAHEMSRYRYELEEALK